MKRPGCALLAAGLLVALLLGLGALALADTDIVLGRYPNALPQSLSVHQIQGRLILQNSTYETSDPPNVVADWYTGRYHLEPDHDPVIQGQCVRLDGVNGVSVLRQTVVVSMCVAGDVTRVYFDRSGSLGQ
jgi:hypothetical protein